MALRHPQHYKAFLRATVDDWLQAYSRSAVYAHREARAFATVVLAGLRQGFMLDYCSTCDRKRQDHAVGLWLRTLDSMLPDRQGA